ncbi:zf-HC2 domain-containing protein [Amycolatopsis rhizosphaerae]|uniref:Zf-HC2 domain-containing protein n=1 Tax=Amycolatopsis rhizosphaerae TaxID=2053003 RepID=A0A558ADJ9_9PSEU|nr:zf-HC2 domain-containing protein [Amycolatopsis rhizosphaerae]TVT22329.1 zf-HC2 domain-containing protein [Amycolatopsis rhizosphaerae]
MSDPRGWSLLPESHLLPDAIVAFVDGELSLGARDRAASHITRCPGCAADVAAQRQARAAVKRASAPSMSAGFLASLRAIPEHTDLPTTPDNLAVTEDGQLVAIQRPDRVAGLRDMQTALGSGAPLGSSTPLGSGSSVLGSQRSTVRRRAAQGAGVVVSGIVLSALALVATSGGGGSTAQVNPQPGPNPGVLRAQMGGQQHATPVTTTISACPALHAR